MARPDKEEVIAAIRKCAEDLGHVPTLDELLRVTKMSKYAVRGNFGPYRKALEACGLERHGCGYKVEMKDLFLDWARVTRLLGKVPSMLDYELHGRYTTKPLVRHFGGWTHVPAGLLCYARESQLEDEWKDVLDFAASALKYALPPARTSVRMMDRLPRAKIAADAPVYGAPMAPLSLTYAPTNEAGVVFLFGTVAREMGFAVTRVQTEFPDCEAMREVQPDRWQRVRIEFEYESRNFLAHLHPVDRCDLIVCWNHNWQECPLEVLELKTAVRGVAADLRR